MPTTQELSHFLGLLYDAAAQPALWDSFLEQVARASGATSAALVVHDFQNPYCTVSSSWALDPELQKLYEAHYYDLDLWAKRGSTQAEGAIITSQALCPLQELKKTEIYNDLYVSSQIEHAAFAILKRDATCLAGFSLYRDRLRPEFTNSDIQLLQFLTPHLQRAFSLHFRLSSLTTQSASLEAALDASRTPTLLLTQNGTVVYMNKSAVSLFAERDGLLMTAGGLVAQNHAESQHLSAMIRNASSRFGSSGDNPGASLLISRHTRPALRLFLAPIRECAPKDHRKSAIVVFVTDPLQIQRPSDSTLRSNYSLTPAECRVALLLADGHSPKEISTMLAVTDHTIRSQIKSIFAKTGVRRQAELVALVLTSQPPES